MTNEKFTSEIKTLKKFFEVYCKNKQHNNIKIQKKQISYKGIENLYEFSLCDDCFNLLLYSCNKLQNCPHDIKPMCRSCPSPCYEPKQWKLLAKLMRFSGIKLGLLKIKKLFS
jgi:hypothetical protein